MARDDPEAVNSAVFLAVVEKYLHSEANAEERLCRSRFLHWLDEPESAQVLHRAFRRAHSGKHDAICRRNHLRIARHYRLHAERGKGKLHARKIPGLVVYYRCHLSLTLWLDILPFSPPMRHLRFAARNQSDT